MSRSEERSSSESKEEPAIERELSRDVPGSRSQLSESNSEDASSSDSEEEELPPLPQVSLPSSEEGASDSPSSSEDDSASEATGSEPDDSSSSQSEGSLPAHSDPAVLETSSQLPGSRSGEPASSGPEDDPEGPGVSSSRSVSLAASGTSRSVSEDSGSSDGSQDAASESVAEGAPLQQADPDSTLCHGAEAQEQPAEASDIVTSDLPSPSLSNQRSRSAGESPRQQGSGSEGGLSAEEASHPDPEAPHGAQAPGGVHPSRPSTASFHRSDSDDSPPQEQPLSFPTQPHVALPGPATVEQSADVFLASQAGQEDDASSSEQAVSGTKRGRGAAEDAATQPELKRRRSVFQRCSEALSGTGLVYVRR